MGAVLFSISLMKIKLERIPMLSGAAKFKSVLWCLLVDDRIFLFSVKAWHIVRPIYLLCSLKA